MVIKIKIDDGYEIEKVFAFKNSELKPGKINLASLIGTEMRYHNQESTEEVMLIDYPGEYNIQDWMIKVFIGKNQKLNYLIEGVTRKFGIVQSPDVLEEGDVDDMDAWLYKGENIEKKIDQLELEGEKINLETLGQDE